jgi:hypothetical protein
MKFFHSTNKLLPKSFIVSGKFVSSGTVDSMNYDYGEEDFAGALFVSPEKDYSNYYGKYVYEITSKKKPLMVTWNIFIYPIGTRVNAVRVK